MDLDLQSLGMLAVISPASCVTDLAGSPLIEHTLESDTDLVTYSRAFLERLRTKRQVIFGIPVFPERDAIIHY